MRKLTDLQKEVKELKGKETVTYVVGKTISDMLTAEPRTCKKIDVRTTMAENMRKGLIFHLFAEPGRETIEEAIAGYIAEQARQARQRDFFSEPTRLDAVKTEIEKYRKNY